MRSAAYHLCSLSALALIALSAAACSSTSASDDALATGRPRPVTADKYPDISQPLDSAMAQMTDEEAERQEKQLSALARQRKLGRISEAEYRRRVAELRQLGAETQ